MVDVLKELSRAITTECNDDISKPRTPERERFVQRIRAMEAARDEIERLRQFKTGNATATTSYGYDRILPASGN